MQVALGGELDDEKDAEDFVALSVGGVGHRAGEDVAQREQPLGELVVGAVEVEEREGDGVDGRGRRQRREVVVDVLPGASLPGFAAASSLPERVQPSVDDGAQAVAQPGQRPAHQVGEENGAADVGRPLGQGGQAAARGFHLDEVAVFFAERPVAGEGGEAEVEEGGEGAQLRREGVGRARAEQAAVQVGHGIGEVAGEVGVLLVGAHNVWRGGERVW